MKRLIVLAVMIVMAVTIRAEACEGFMDHYFGSGFSSYGYGYGYRSPYRSYSGRHETVLVVSTGGIAHRPWDYYSPYSYGRGYGRGYGDSYGRSGFTFILRIAK